MTNNNELHIAIIGAGPSGIAAGHELLKQGFTQFTIFEKAAAAGGTWHLHTYPGLACDVFAHSYTFSYAPNPNWSANFVPQPEIEAYIQRCASEFGLNPHIQFNTRITTANYQSNGTWLLTTEDGKQIECDVVINAMGNQHTAQFPNVNGIEQFAGDYWHGTEWNHDVDLHGKRVVVVGSAASAVQIVPEVAKVAAHLTVLQRTPNWIMPRRLKAYSPLRRALYRRFPILLTLTKSLQHLLLGLVLDATTLGHNRMKQFENVALRYINKMFPPGPLRDAVTPNTRYGCKRGLVSDDFYPTLLKENVELIAQGLQEVKTHSIVTNDGREIAADVIIYCTGYRILDFDRICVTGMHDKNLAEVMQMAPEAYKGIAVPDFPNYFFTAGPNGLVLNVSYFDSCEKNIETVVRLLKQKQAKGIKAISVKHAKHREYNDWMQTLFEKFSWGSSSCNSYYNTESGHVPFLFSGSYKNYCAIHEKCSIEDFDSV
jgi:cation diffusion facilitator CzcD-associated flavoprotein CzcO